MSAVWILPLDAARDPRQAGGKTATLARLRALGGIPIPDGFCITVAAFDAAHGDDAAATGGVMPPALADAIRAAYRQIGADRVAVRSSGVAEDLAGASFAGQYATVLNVEGEDAVLDAVRQVWASAGAARAAAYAAVEGQRAAGMAVLVQRMAAADCAGVLFTRSPEPGRSEDMVIEAAPGLGEAVVSASVTPDRYRLRRAPLRLTDAVISLRIEEALGGPQDIEGAADDGQLWVLQARPITTLRERLTGDAGDSEPPPPPMLSVHDVAGTRAYSSAPHRDTALPLAATNAAETPVTAAGAHSSGRIGDVWSRANVGEVFPGVVSPITWSAVQAGLKRHTRDLAQAMKVDPASLGQMFGLFHGRVYLNVGLVHYLMTEVIGLSSEHFEESLGGPGRSEGLPLPHRPVSWRKLLRSAPALIADLKRAGDLPAQADAIIAACRTKLAEVQALDLPGLSLEELTELAGNLSAFAQPHWMFHIQTSGTAFGAYGMLSGALRGWFGDGSLANDLLTGLATLRTTAISEDLWIIARRAAADPALAAQIAATPTEGLVSALESTATGQAALDDLRTFLKEHGHRTHNELDMMEPRWADDPRPILAVYKGYVAANPDGDPASFGERQRLRRLATERELKARLSRGLEALLPARRLAFNFLRDRAQRLVPLRENVKY
ncbi:MAG: hypothetical protein NTZ05_15020, partial [Chloroflexi bacterium]|nr:hypothetical protein [Chloroflexota bacterium]